MQKCKYLDDLGLKPEDYGTNCVPDDDERAEDWLEEREMYGFDSRETWCLEYTFFEWIYTRLMMYKECCSGVIDLSFHKIQYKDKEITQLEAINLILDFAKEAIISRDDEVMYKNGREICDIWKEVLPCMWW